MHDGKRILVVEDDMLQRDALVNLLGQTGEFEIQAAASGEEALAIIAGSQQDVIVLDIMLPGQLDGFDVARQVVAEQRPCAIIMLTGRDSDADMEAGLESGAVTYLRKPISLRILLKQINAVLSSSQAQRQNVMKIGDLFLHPLQRVLTGQPAGRDEQAEIKLTDMQTRLLQYLYEDRGNFVTVETLLAEVWNYSPEANTHTVQSHVHRIREAVRSRGFERDLIVTERGRGYRLVAR